MKETAFHIIMNIKTCNGFESFGRFCIGNKREFAEAVFKKMKGNKNVDEKTILNLDLVETVNNLPVNMQVLSCSLEEIAENCRTITKETFKIFNLKET